MINIINNEAGTDYKRYWTYGCNVRYSESTPHNMNPYCELCKKHFAKNDNKQGCLGTNNKNNVDKPCDEFDSAIEN